jgi:hypothetical protein
MWPSSCRDRRLHARHGARDELLPRRARPDFESGRWTTFRTSACTLALHAGSESPDPTFEVADAAVERDRLIAAGVEVTEIREPVAGLRVFDDGNRFSIESRAAG